MIEAADFGALAAPLRDGAYDRLGRPLGELVFDAFDDLFALVTDVDFPAERAAHVWR